MKKTLWFTVGLVLAAAALGAYFFMSGGHQPADQRPGEGDPSIILPEGLSPTGITVKGEAGVIRMESPDGVLWRITEPVETFAHPIYMQILLGDSKELKKERIIDISPADLSIYQLDQPRGEIIFSYADGRPDVHLVVGKMNYTRDHLFAKLADSPTVFLIDPKVQHFFESPLDGFRAKVLLLHPPYEILSFKVKIEDPAFKAANPWALEPKLVVQSQVNEKPQWVIVDPIRENADFNMVKTFLNGLRQTSAGEVIDIQDERDLAKFGLDQPRVRIHFTTVGGEAEEVVFGDPDETGSTIYARNTALNEVLPVHINLFQSLVLSNFRSSVISESMDIRNITAVWIEFPQSQRTAIRIERKDRMAFAMVEGEEAVVPRGRITWIGKPFKQNSIVFLHQKEPFPREKYGLDRPGARIKIYEGERTAVDVSLGDTVTEGVNTLTFIEDHIRKCIVFVYDDLYDIIPMKPEHLKATPEELELIKERRLRRGK